MDLLKAVQVSSSLEKVKEIVDNIGIPADSNWFDYECLNAALESRQKDVAIFLLENGCRVNRTIEVATAVDTPLHYAVKQRDMELVHLLLNRKASITGTNKDQDTPMHLAFMIRHDQIVDAMLLHVEHTNYANPKDKQGLTHMHIACIRNNAKVVEGFLESGIDIEHPINSDSYFMPNYKPLHLAVEFTCLDVVKVLLVAGAKKDLFSNNEIALNDLARRNFGNASIIEYLILGKKQEYLYFIPQYGLSNFHHACMTNDSTLVEKFIENGADVDSSVRKTLVHCSRYTPLHCAVDSNCKKNVELLLQHGASVEMRNENGMTPLHLALYNDPKSQNSLSTWNSEEEDNSSVVDMLYKVFQKTSDREWLDVNGMTYFHIACTRNDVEVVRHLLDKGADVNGVINFNTRNFQHHTPLHFAAEYRCKEVAQLLIQQGANVNKVGMWGTPLHLAFVNGDMEMVELLLSHGAKVNVARPYDNKNMLHLFIDELMNRNIHHNDWRIVNQIIDKIGRDEDIYVKKLVELGCNVNGKDVKGNTALHIACTKLRDGEGCARILLELGADINIENDEGETPFDMSFCDIYRMNADSYMMLYHHVQKLKALGLEVNPKNEKCCAQILSDKDECDPDAHCFSKKNLAKKHQQRLDEIKKMKNTKIDKRTSLYKVLLEKMAILSEYSQNENFKKIVEADDFDKEYPSYGFMLKLQYKLGLFIAKKINEMVDDDEKVEKKSNKQEEATNKIQKKRRRAC